ncbi:MAG: hypothetical protein LBS01_09880 [Prevotellaceae bacterium]|jgi:hypothetical protein|nr:hypothetical protein [Prevotellaceae bacterium]
MRRFFLIVLFVTFHFGQLLLSQIEVKCNVQNEEGVSLAFATAYCINSNSGIAADTLGNIVIKVNSATDSIRFSNIGYYPNLMQVKDILLEPIVRLEPQTISLNEVIILSSNRDISLIDSKSSAMGFNGRVGSILLVKIIKPQKTDSVISNIIAEIKSLPIGFKIKNNNLFKLRARVYTVGKDGFPEYDLLTENVELEFQKGQKYIVADVSKYAIKMPSSGIFVGFEWLPKEQTTIDYNRVITGPLIAATKESDMELTVSGSISGNWEYFTMADAPFFMSKKPQNAKIGIKF